MTLKPRMVLLKLILGLALCAQIGHSQKRPFEGGGRIQNLNEYLGPFRSCLVPLINYEGLDFEPFASPVVLSRYLFIASDGRPALKAADVNNSPVKMLPYEYYLFFSPSLWDSSPDMESFRGPWEYAKTTSTKWRCFAQFYLFPPDVSNEAYYKTRDMHLRAPEGYTAFWKSGFTAQGVYSNYLWRYPVLVEPVAGFSIKSRVCWVRLVDTQTSWNSEATVNSLVLSTEIGTTKTLPVFRITRASLVCTYCELRHRAYIPFENARGFTKDSIDAQFRVLNRVMSTPWLFLEMPKEVPGLETKNFDASGAKQENEIVHFTAVKNFTADRMTVEILIFELAAPNVSFVDRAQTLSLCRDFESCDRHRTIPYPEIAVNTNKYFYMQGKDFYTFLTCGGASKSLIDFRGFISAFDYPSWTLILLTGCIVGLFVIAVKTWNSRHNNIKGVEKRARTLVD